MLGNANNLAESRKCFDFFLDVLRKYVIMRRGRGQ